MKHFLDFGTHRFGGLHTFIEKFGIDSSWHVWCYEANKQICQQNQHYVPLWESKFASFQLFEQAVNDYTGIVQFNRHKGAWSADKKGYGATYDTGSNILVENPPRDEHNAGVHFDVEVVETDCVDIAEIMDMVLAADPDAEIYMKCDIEGAEFKVLPRLLESPHVDHIKEMHIEWHERFFYDPAKHSEMVQLKHTLLDAFNGKGILCCVH